MLGDTPFVLGILPSADPPDLLPGWERLALPIVSAPVTGGRGGGPSSGTLLEVSGAELSSVRRTDEGDVEVRVWNPTAEERTDRVGDRTVALGPARIETIRLPSAP